MTGWEYLFWGSVGAVVYAYVGYPVVVWLLSRFYPDPVTDNLERIAFERGAPRTWPRVSLIIAAFREEQVIAGRLINATLLDYPADQLEILIGVDGDEDLTGEIVAGFQDSRVRLLQFPQRRGKASVLNDCVEAATGEILVFSDANTNMDTGSLRTLVRHFAEPRVGGVCGRLMLVDSIDGSNVDGLYWRMENFLKSCESRVGGLLGVNGGIYAIRKSLYQPIPPQTIVDDFLIGMRVHLSGRHLLYEPDAVAVEETPPTIDAEFHRRARIGAGGFQSLAWLWRLLNPLYGWVAFTFWSHKILRWACPLFLMTAVLANAVLAVQSRLYAVLFLGQVALYLAAALGGTKWGAKAPRLMRVPAMFVSMNAALFVGFLRWARGIRGGTWKRTERSAGELERTAAG